MNFAFVYIYGDKINLGRKLTHSIKISHPDSFIIQITDLHAKSIDTVDHVERVNFYNETFIYDCIKAKRRIINKFGPTVFLDSDMLILESVNEFYNIQDYDFSITTRPKNYNQFVFTPNKLHKQKFPEIIGRKVGDVMPYNAGIFYCKNVETLEYMLTSYNAMNKNYHEWYGDQIALKEMVDVNMFKIKFFDGNIYNYTPESVSEDFSDKKALHFKGNKKDYFDPIYDRLFNNV
jgi:hypothetical protein